MSAVFAWIGWLMSAGCFLAMLNAAYIGLVVKSDWNNHLGQAKRRADLLFIIVLALVTAIFAYPTIFKAPFSWSIFS